jgi:hypothetical protein
MGLLYGRAGRLTAENWRFPARAALAADSLRDWAIVGPFDDSTSTGMWRKVSTADKGLVPSALCTTQRGCQPSDSASWQKNRTAADLNATYADKTAGSSATRWKRWQSPVGPYAVPVAHVLDDDGWGSAAILQTAVHCDKPTMVNVSFSTAGVGALSIWTGADPKDSLGGQLLWGGFDEVYAGLFESEVKSARPVTMPSGWSTVQLKTLSQFGVARGWEAAASLMGLFGGAGNCRVDACGAQPDAMICVPPAQRRLLTDDVPAPAWACDGHLEL